MVKISTSDRWPAGGGEMGKLIRSKDWSKTQLGPVENWPNSLKTMVGVVLGSRFPMLLWWGPDLLHLYNDAYRPILRDKHPASLGAPGAKIWAEVWNVAGPMAESVLKGGPATWTEDLQLFINSGAMAEETFFTFSYSPVPGDDGQIGGILNTVQETTVKVQSERQIRLLNDLAARASEAKSEHQAYHAALKVLESDDLDFPFAALYAVADKASHAQLAGTTSWQNYSGPAKVASVPLKPDKNQSASWPLDKVFTSGHELVVDDLSSRFGVLPKGRWETTPEQAIILPLTRVGRSKPDAFLIAGVSPHRELDDRYLQFLRATADQLVSTITNVRAYEAEKKRAEELAELDKAKSLFFSNVSHEFRTPLTLMLGPLEDSLANHDLPKEHHEQLELMYRNSLRLQRLVNSLLDFSSIEAGRMKAVFQPVDLAGFTRELASTFQPAMTSAHLRFEIDCKPLKQKVYVDYSHWEKIILNLLSNALKFTFKGTIKVTVSEKNGSAEVQISDTGTGIQKAELPHLFERFHRVSGAKSRTAEGSGIGLALVYELVKLHSGTLDVKSTPGKGTTFTIHLPFGADHLPKDQLKKVNESDLGITKASRAYLNDALDWTKAPEHHDDAADQRVKSKWDQTILIVEDNPDMSEYIRRTINANTSLRVVNASNGREALEIIKKRLPNLIITDIMMPEMDGFELVYNLRKNPATAHLPIIFLSARAGEEAKLEGIAEGVDDYLTKPFSAKELVARVNNQLNLAMLRGKSKK